MGLDQGTMHKIIGIEVDMKTVADIDIPFLQGVFEPYGEVVYKKGDQISRDDVQDADVLIVRTRTRCDAHLLEGTSVKMISTATQWNPPRLYLLQNGRAPLFGRQQSPSISRALYKTPLCM